MIQELSPLHHHHGELGRVPGLVPVYDAADEPGVGERTVGDGPSELLNTITEYIIFSIFNWF